jgi:hypothetical protein
MFRLKTDSKLLRIKYKKHHLIMVLLVFYIKLDTSYSTSLALLT